MTLSGIVVGAKDARTISDSGLSWGSGMGFGVGGMKVDSFDDLGAKET